MKSDRFAPLLAKHAGSSLDPHYLAYFDFFNHGLFFEAHEVLEQIWLPERGKPKGLFFKGLIQLAGAFVHVQKNRTGPALALLRLAQANLHPYVPVFDGLDVASVLHKIELLLDQLTSEAECRPLCRPPKLELRSA